MKPDQRTSIVTGASKGIGRATAELLAARGENVIGAARSPKPSGFHGDYYEVDFSDESAIRQFILEIGNVIAFLMGDGASFITGQTLYVDGGASVGKVMV